MIAKEQKSFSNIQGASRGPKRQKFTRISEMEKLEDIPVYVPEAVPA